MDERKVHIDEFFRRQMDGYTEMPPPAVWDALEKRLDEKPGRKRPIPIWWFWTIAGLILLSSAVIIAGYLNNNTPPAALHVPSNMQQTAVAPVAPIVSNQQSDNHEKNNNQHTTSNSDKQVVTDNINQEKNKAYSTDRPDDNAGNGQNKAANIPSVAHTKGNLETRSATTDNNMPGIQRFSDKLRLLSSIPFGFELPVQIPLAPAPDKVNLPETTESGLGNSSTIARLPAPATDHPVIPAPVPEVAAVSGLSAFSKSIPGPGDNGNETEHTEIMISSAPPAQDTSKKKTQTATDTSKSILDQTVYAVDDSKKKPLPFAAGIKLGFTRGFDPVWNANKWVIAPYVEYGLSSNFSVMFQPAFLIGKAKVGTLPNSDQVFYEILNTTFDSIAYVSRGKIDSSIITPNPPDTVFRTYRYGQVYDSIHVGYKVTNTQQWDAELPIMVKYKVNKTFAFIVGASATYSSVLRTKEEVTRYQGLMRQYEDVHAPQTFFVTVQGQEPPAGPPRKDAGNLFPYNTSPFSNYQPRQITETNNFWRYGFMVGASASIKERLMVELMLHKSGVDVNSVPDKQLQKIYTQPYLRLMVGYKLTK